MDEGEDRLVQRCHCGTVAQLQTQISSVTKGKGRHVSSICVIVLGMRIENFISLVEWSEEVEDDVGFL